MPEFKDAENRTWNLALTIGTARRLRDEVGVDFAALGDGKIFFELGSDPYKLGATLWVLVERQAERLSVTPEAFVDALDGPAIDRSVEALLEAVVNFTPAAMRGPVKKLIEQVGRARTASMTAVEDWIGKMEVETLAIEKTNEALTRGGESQP